MSSETTSAFKALIVELIRRLWDQGLMRQSTPLQLVHDHWFDYWVEFKTRATMREVDQQAQAISEGADEQTPTFTEESKGKTALGGFMRLSSPHRSEG